MNKMRTIFLGVVLTVSAAVWAQAAGNLSQLNVYPNPVRRAAGHQHLTFDNLTPQVRIRIYTAHGVLVRDVSIAGGGNSFQWNLKNEAGQEVASGVYIYLLNNDAGEKRTGKVAVFR